MIDPAIETAAIRQIMAEAARLTASLTGKKQDKIDLSSRSFSQAIGEGFVCLLQHLERKGRPLDTLDAIDVGVGKGWSSFILARHLHTVRAYDLEYTVSEQLGLDQQHKWQKPFWDHYAALSSNLSYHFFDGSRVDVPDETADLVVAEQVLEHVGNDALENDRRVEWLKEIRRIVKPGGVFYLSEAPNARSYTEALGQSLGLGAHKKRFSRKEIVALIQDSGFRIDSLQYTHPYPDFYPGLLLPAWNRLYEWCFQWIEKPLLATPLKYVSHHFRIVATKPECSGVSPAAGRDGQTMSG